MPRPIVLLTVCFGAGLLTGLSAYAGVPLALGLAALALAGRKWAPAILLTATSLGIFHGVVARRFDTTRCAALLTPGPVSLEVRLIDPGRPGRGMVSAKPGEGSCSGTLTIRWRGTAEVDAGSLITVRGSWVERPGRGGRPNGVVVAETISPRIAEGDRGERGPTWSITSAAERLYGPRAPMVEALVLGKRHDLDREVKDAFTRSGLVHLLAISGFHVGLLAGWIYLTALALGFARGVARLLAVSAAAAYVGFLGWPPPATRAVTLLAVLAVGMVRQRRLQPGSLLAVCCLVVMLVDPWSVRDVGAWLSASAIGGVTRLTRWSDRVVGRHWAIRTAAASLGATLSVAPLTALVFGTVAIAGVVMNFLAVPLAGLAVPAVFLSLGLDSISPRLAATFAAAGGLGLAGLEAVARLGAGIPGGAILVEPTVRSAVPWLLVAGGAFWMVDRRNALGETRRRGLLVGTAVLWLSLTVGLGADLGTPRPGLTLYHLNVGQGDAAVVRTPRGRWLVIDAGPAGYGADAGRRVVAPFLIRKGARGVTAMVVSHAHSDHLGGAESIFDRLRVESVLDPAVPLDDSLYLSFLDRLGAEGIRWHQARRGDQWVIDDVTVSVLHPDTTWIAWREDLNEDSIVLLLEYGRFRAVFAGDAGHPVESVLRGEIGSVNLLKVGHHGSRGSSGPDWLRELDPELAVISVGRNGFGHPSTQALANLTAAGASVWRTDRDGTIAVWTDGRRVEVAGRDRKETFVLGKREDTAIQEEP